MKDLYESKDKQIVPFLLVSPDINFVGIRKEGWLVFFQFSPANKCEELVNLFSSRKAPLVQPKDLLDAVETFRDRIFEMKEKQKYEGKTF